MRNFPRRPPLAITRPAGGSTSFVIPPFSLSLDFKAVGYLQVYSTPPSMDRLPGARASEHRHNRQARHHTSRRGGGVGGGGGGKRVAVFVAMFRALSVNLPPRVRACWLSSNWRPTCRHESRRTRHAGSARLNYTQDCPVGMVRGEKVRQAREGMQKGRGKAREGWTPRGRGGVERWLGV